MLKQLPLNYVQQFCAEQLGLYTYQNYLEVLIFSTVIYTSLRWIQKDYTKSLSLYIYLYSALLIFSHVIQAQILFWTMIIFAPLGALLCIVIHQTTLQKIFVQPTMRQIHADGLPDQQWSEILIRSLLFAAHHQKNIFCVLQRQDSVHYLIDSPYFLNTSIQPEVVDLILSSSMIENPTIMLVDHLGVIKSVNGTWSKRMHDHMILGSNHTTTQHNQQAASIIAQTTNAIVWHIEPTTQQATVWYQDTIIQNVSIDQLLSLCKKHIPNVSDQKKMNLKGEFHAQKSNSPHSTSSQH